MKRRIFAALLALFLFAFYTLAVKAQPVGGDTLTNGELEKVQEPIQLWVADSTSSNPVPDSFYVHEATDGQYWRSKIDGGTGGYFYRCPTPETVFNLSGTQSALSTFSSGMEEVVQNGTPANLPQVQVRAECVQRFSTTLDSLLSILSGREKPVRYASDCRTNINNGTVHIPPNSEFSGLEAPTPGDTVAVYTSAGSCVGWGVWTEHGATLAAAMGDDITAELWPEWDLLQPGEPITFEVYNAEKNRAFRTDPTFASCDTMDIPVCRDANSAEDGVFFQVAKLTFDPLG